MSAGEAEKIEGRFVALSMDELEQIIKDAAYAGAMLAAENVKKDFRAEDKRRDDRRLHNTRLLLKNYRSLKENCKKSVYYKEEYAAEALDDIMRMDGDEKDKVIVESIKRSAEKTSIIIMHIDKMLDVFRIYCGKCSDRERRQYKVIKALYIAKQKKSVAALAKEFNVSKVTIYDDIKIAERHLSVLFFGINGLKINS